MATSGGGALLLIMGGGLAWYGFSLKQFRILKKIEYTPTCKVIAAAPGEIELVGRARQGRQLLNSPLNKKSCVYYCTRLFYWHGSGKSRKRSCALTLNSQDPFLLTDDTGYIQVDPGALSGDNVSMRQDVHEGRFGAPTEVSRKFGLDLMGALNTLLTNPLSLLSGKNDMESRSVQAVPLLASEKADPVFAFVAEKYPKLRGYNDRVEVEETFIEEGDSFYVLGTASMVDSKDALSTLVVSRAKGKAFYLKEGNEAQARLEVGVHTYLGLALGPLVFGAAGIIMVGGMQGPFAEPILVIMLALYAIALGVHVLEMYNGMVVLRNQIDSARANLEALYQRRQELIPSLVDAIVASRAYEKGVQENIARWRADAVLSANKDLIALSEKYPELAANQNFRQLQEELMRTEEWIAASRAYVLDSITLYNIQIQHFPQSLLAPVAGLKAMALQID